jgi:hypothetical protein
MPETLECWYFTYTPGMCFSWGSMDTPSCNHCGEDDDTEVHHMPECKNPYCLSVKKDWEHLCEKCFEKHFEVHSKDLPLGYNLMATLRLDNRKYGLITNGMLVSKRLNKT